MLSHQVGRTVPATSPESAPTGYRAFAECGLEPAVLSSIGQYTLQKACAAICCRQLAETRAGGHRRPGSTSGSCIKRIGACVPGAETDLASERIRTSSSQYLVPSPAVPLCSHHHSLRPGRQQATCPSSENRSDTRSSCLYSSPFTLQNALHGLDSSWAVVLVQGAESQVVGCVVWPAEGSSKALHEA